MPRNPHKTPCQYPACHAWARPRSPFCAAHTPTIPDDPNHDDLLGPLLQALLLPAPDALPPIEKELHYLMALRRCLDQAALYKVSHGRPFDLTAHAALQCQVSNRILRAAASADPTATRPSELADLVDQVYADLADAFPALKPPS